MGKGRGVGGEREEGWEWSDRIDRKVREARLKRSGKEVRKEERGEKGPLHHTERRKMKDDENIINSVTQMRQTQTKSRMGVAPWGMR